MAKYIDLKIQTLEPFKVVQQGKSIDEQYETYNYIPGASLRGYFINHIEKYTDKSVIESILLSNDICFLNAYPIAEGHQTYPSPKGFYENKEDNENIVSIFSNQQGPAATMKRAKLGAFSYFEDEYIKYSTPEKAEKLRIAIKEGEDNELFRSSYLEAGQNFQGQIIINKDDDTSLQSLVLRVFENEDIRIGSSRSAGYGLCHVETIDTDISNAECRVEDIVYSDTDNEKKYIFMTLLSDMTMLSDYGECCGINEAELERKLGVSELKVCKSSTSVVRSSGMNRSWGCRIATDIMYEAGSVFKIEFLGEIDAEDIKKIENAGLGIRTNEGFGQVSFSVPIGRLTKKSEVKVSSEDEKVNKTMTEDDKKVLKLAAKGRYLHEINMYQNKNTEKMIDWKNLSKSQIGSIEAVIQECRYTPDNIRERLDEFFSTMKKDAESQKKFGDVENELIKFYDSDIDSILKTSFDGKECIYDIPKQEILTKSEHMAIMSDVLLKQLSFNRNHEKTQL